MDFIKLFLQIPSYLLLWIIKLLDYICYGLLSIINLIRKFCTYFITKLLSKYKTLIGSIFIIGGLIIFGGIYTYFYYQNNQQPKQITELTNSYKLITSIPQEVDNDLRISFIDQNEENADLAPIEKINKILDEGISINPKVDGNWQWVNASTLVFKPKTSFRLDTRYNIEFQQNKLFNQKVDFSSDNKKDLSFELNLKPRLKQKELYLDPNNSSNKQAIFQFEFDYDIDLKSIENKIKLGLYNYNSDSLKEKLIENLPYTISYQKNYKDKKFELVIKSKSEAIKLKEFEQQIKLQIPAGITTVSYGGYSKETIEQQLNIPNIYGLKVEKTDLIAIRNQKNQLEQVLNIYFNSPVKAEQVVRYLNVLKLNNDNGKSYIGEKVIFKALPTEKEYSKLVSFTLENLRPEEPIVLQINPKVIKSQAGLILGDTYTKKLYVPEYPETLSFIGDGSILSLKGEHKIAYNVQGIKTYKVRVAEVRTNQLQNLVYLSKNQFSKMSFGNNSIDSFVNSHVKVYQQNQNEIAENKVKDIDLTDIFDNSKVIPKGIYVIQLYKSYRQENNKQEINEYDDELMSSRFVMITDMGVIAKKASNNKKHDIFVQSISTGNPVENAKVYVIAENGVKLIGKNTDKDGHVSFNYEELYEKNVKPLFYLIEDEYEDDYSFLPLNYFDRNLNYSRFDIDGEMINQETKGIKTHIFSDRMVYRPGEKFNLGLIIKAQDWSDLKGIPIDIMVYDPSDNLVDEKTIKLDSIGFYEYGFKTKETSPTGLWNIRLFLHSDKKDEERDLYLDSSYIYVRDFMPDQTKVNLDIEQEQGWLSNKSIIAKLNAKTLFETPAQNRRIKTSIILTPSAPKFDKYKDYMFFNIENKEVNDVKLDLNDQYTDQAGNAEINIGKELSNFDGNYFATIKTDVYESNSGRSVSQLKKLFVSNNNYLIGAKSNTDLSYIPQNHNANLDLVAINSNLEKIDLAQLKLSIEEVQYVSVLMKQEYTDTYKYESVKKNKEIYAESFKLDKQGTNYQLKTDVPGEYVLTLKDQQDKIVYQQPYFIAGNSNISRSLSRNSELKLKLNNKKAYLPGEEIEVSINAPYIGSGLITIERDKVYTYKWFKTTSNNSIQTITLPEGIDGNAYINVQFLRDPNSVDIFMSPLSYGVIPFKISTDKFRSNIEINAPSLVKSGQSIKANVSVEKPQKVILFAVDQGILQYANYKLKDPLDDMYKKIMLSVTTDQILDLILPEYRKIINTYAAGGDGNNDLSLKMMNTLSSHLNPFKRKLNDSAVYWSGIKMIEDSGDFTIPVPNEFNGKMIIMAVGVSEDSISTKQIETVVKDDFVITPNLPNFVSPDDQFEINFSVVNNLNLTSGQKVDLKIELEDSSIFEILDQKTNTLQLAKEQEGSAKFKLKTKQVLGNANIKVKLSYQDKIINKEYNLSVRPASAYQTDMQIGRINKQNKELINKLKYYNNFYNYDAMISYNPISLAKGLVIFLDNYTYNCTEQLLSKMVPLLISKNNPELAIKTDNEKVSSKELIQILRERQTGDGGFGYWDNKDPEQYVSLYGLDYLLLAKEQGYDIPQDLIDNLNIYVKRIADGLEIDEHISSLDQLRHKVYAMYLLSKQQIVSGNVAQLYTNITNSNEVDKPWTKDVNAVYLAASLKRFKLEEQAKLVLKPVLQELAKVYDKAWWNSNYYDPLLVNAEIIYLLNKEFPEQAKLIPVQALENMSAMLNQQNYNSLTAAKTILALDAYSGRILKELSKIDNTGLSIETKPNSILPKISTLFVTLEGKAAISSLTFKNSQTIPAWYSFSQQGYLQETPKQAIKNGLEVYREYTDNDGKKLTQAKLGDEITVILRVKANAKEGLTNIALVDLLPGGFEVKQSDIKPLKEDSEEVNNVYIKDEWNPSSVDIREDRIILYGNLFDATTKTYKYKIKATSIGEFNISRVYVESMYNRSINGSSIGGEKIKILP